MSLLAAGPFVLFALIINKHLRAFQNNTTEEIFWCTFFLTLPGWAALPVH